MGLSYPWVALLTLAIGLVLGLLGYPLPYLLPWFMFTTAILASPYGLGVGLGVVLASSLALVFLGGLDPVGVAILLLAAYLAHDVGQSLRRAHSRARALAQAQRLIAEALEALPQASGWEELLQALPGRLSALGEKGHVGVWVPEGEGFRLLAANTPLSLDWIPATGVVGRAYREGRPIYIPDVQKEPGYIPDPGIPTRAELALPLLEKEEVVAVLNLERPKAFLPEEVEGLTRLAQTVSLELDRLADLWSQKTLSGLSLRLQEAREVEEAAEAALLFLLGTLDLEAGAVWEAQGGRMLPLAYRGPEELFTPELPYGQGLVWRVYQEREATFTSAYQEEPGRLTLPQVQGLQALAILPLLTPGNPRARRVLVLGSLRPRRWRKAEQETLALAARFLGLALEGLEERARHRAIGELFQTLAANGGELEALHARLLEKAVRWVPGAEAGSLLVLDREAGVYRYQAALGYDLEGLREVAFSLEAQAEWYGLGPEKALKGEPRVLSNVSIPIAEVSHKTGPAGVMDRAGRVREIQANLCLPLPHRGEVLAYLNLDNLHDPLAFGEDSLEAARFFAPPLAALLKEADTRKRLEEAALTDPLTGLPNRRAFDHVLQEELARAERYGYPLSLLVLDLVGFKAINDRLGHAQGDLALIQVAQALEKERRNGDKVFRWGGDEFAALLPHTPKMGAVRAAFRYAEAIRRIQVQGLALGVNIGVAAYPEDGLTPDALLSAADGRMYRAKAQGVPVLAEGVGE